MKIDQLPVEMLMKIFSFLPTYSDVSLVNKLFYGISCKVNDSNICLRIDNQMDAQCLHSIRTSKRQITKVEIGIHRFSNEDQQLYIPLIENFSSTIKHLTCRYARMDESTFRDILSLTPNIEHLELCALHVCNKDQPPKKRHKDDLNLTKLKSLSIDGCDDEFVRILNHLPVGVLTELQIINFYWHTLTAALNQQLNIKKLKIGCVRCIHHGDYESDELPTEIFDKLNLESMELIGLTTYRAMVPSILMKQRKLKSLIISNTRMNLTFVNDRIMDAVAELSELEIIEINVGDSSHESFVKICKLRKLKDLTLRCGRTDCVAKLKTLAESDNTSLIKLAIWGHFKMSVDLIAALAKSAPNLKSLRIIPDDYLQRGELHQILTCFNFVDTLEIEIFRRPSNDTKEYFNPKLSEVKLFIDGGLYKEWMAILTAVYPNLKKLKLIFKLHSSIVGPLSIQRILDNFRKLESLTFYSDQLIIEDFDTLQSRKGNLKFVSLGWLTKDTLTDDLLKKLRTNFGVVKVKDSECVNMAVDRYTMSCECEKYPYF